MIKKLTRRQYLENINLSQKSMPIQKTKRIHISLPEELLEAFDEACKRQGYTSRSEAFRRLIIAKAKQTHYNYFDVNCDHSDGMTFDDVVKLVKFLKKVKGQELLTPEFKTQEDRFANKLVIIFQGPKVKYD